MITAHELYEKHFMSEGEAQRYVELVSEYLSPNLRLTELVLDFVAEMCDNGFTERHVTEILRGLLNGDRNFKENR